MTPETKEAAVKAEALAKIELEFDKFLERCNDYDGNVNVYDIADYLAETRDAVRKAFLSSAKEPQTEGWREQEATEQRDRYAATMRQILTGPYPDGIEGPEDQLQWIDALIRTTLGLPALPSSGGGHE